MTIMYSARIARPDLLRPVLRLATCLKEWDERCDQKLHRLVRYINSSLTKRLVGWVGDSLDEILPHAYADSDFAGCERTMRSTTGAAMFMEGPWTRFLIAARSLRQGCVSNSTPEAEMVACHFCYKHIVLPSFPIWDELLPEGWRI